MLTPNYQLKRKAKDTLRGHWGNAIITLIVYVVLIILLSLIPLGNIFIGVPLEIGLIYYFLKLAQEKHADIDYIFKPFNFYGNALLAWFLKAIIILLASLPLIIIVIFWAVDYSVNNTVPTISSIISMTIVTLLASLLVIWVAIRLTLVYYIVCDYPSYAADKAIGLSFKAMKGKEWKLVGLYLSFIGWWLLIIPTLGIITLWYVPYLNESLVYFYLDIKQAENLEQKIYADIHKEEIPPQPPKPPIESNLTQ